MLGKKQTAIIISISSDIGHAMAQRFIRRGWDVSGTYRTASPATEALSAQGVRLFRCDLSDGASLSQATAELGHACPAWDSLILCPGALEPVGPFLSCDFSAWATSITVNFTSQMQVVRELLPMRHTGITPGPLVLFFAGGGTNNATLNYSAYTVSKIALMKMCELMDAEITDTRFTILGPGWVRTKIHQATLDAGAAAGANLVRTQHMLSGDGCTSMDTVLDCCDWLMDAPREVVSGRNFSVVHDRWGTEELSHRLRQDVDMYKLRRQGNDAAPAARQVKGEPMAKTVENHLIEDLLRTLPHITGHHAPSTPLYAVLKRAARREVEDLFSTAEQRPVAFQPFGELIFPYTPLGANVDSLNLFDLDELIIFAFYGMNRKRYRKVLDLGANIGLHSIILDKCGFEVRCYEPDPRHFELLRRNITLNACRTVTPVNKAISAKPGELEFVRVLGNTTGSHLSGAKANPYGDLDRFPVQVEGILDILPWADLVKMDIEGQERETLLVTRREHWENTDALIEIENKHNAAAVFEHFQALGMGLFAQKINWGKVATIDDMPTSYHDGTLFVTCRGGMPWNED